MKKILCLLAILPIYCWAATLAQYPTTPHLIGNEQTVVMQNGSTKTVTTSQIAQASVGSASIASASTVDLGSLSGQFVTITGNATINSFGSTAPLGTQYRLYFSGSPTITFNAPWIYLPAEQDFEATPGTWMTVLSLGGGQWTALAESTYQFPNDAVPSMGASLGDALTTISTYLSNIGGSQCINAPLSSSTYTLSVSCVIGEQGYLSKVTSTNIGLCPHKGNNILINGVIYVIPNSCVTLAPTGLTANTLYYIYAYSNSGALTLTASTTGHSTNTTYGYEQETGDATMALVGAAYVTSGPAFTDSATQRLVASWFNPQPKRCINSFSTNRTTTSTSYTEVNSEIECQFIMLGPPLASGAGTYGGATQYVRPTSWALSGTFSNNTTSDGCGVSAGFNTTSSNEQQQTGMIGTSSTPFSVTGYVTSLQESTGLQYMTLLGKAITGGTCNYNSSYTTMEVDLWQ